MSNENSILVVDSNEGFATLLKESLEHDGRYRVALTTNGDDALRTLSSFPFDLAIVDLGLEDPDGVTLAQEMRQQQADLRLMLIPIQGEELPAEAANLDIQGILPKPFFLPELPGRIADALAQSVKVPVVKAPETKAAPAEVASSQEPEQAKPEKPPPPSRPAASSQALSSAREHTPEMVNRMNVLAQEINADAVLLTSKGRVISHTGRISAEGAVGLAQAVAESWRTSARVAQILGQELTHFEQSTEGGEHMFYSLAVAEDIILSVALRASVPLGMIRHRTKEAADALRTLLTSR
ncbi:MAG: response regulator [Anaerolineae bacterium]|nr:response regulator [Anaerolineae bacterium]